MRASYITDQTAQTTTYIYIVPFYFNFQYVLLLIVFKNV